MKIKKLKKMKNKKGRPLMRAEDKKYKIQMLLTNEEIYRLNDLLDKDEDLRRYFFGYRGVRLPARW